MKRTNTRRPPTTGNTVVFPPPATAQDDQRGYGSSLDDHYLSVDVQKSGKRAYNLYLTDHEARKFLDFKLEVTRCAIEHVKEKLTSHGDTLLSRWKKYSHEKRAAILRNAAGSFQGAWQEAEAWRPDPKTDPWGFKEPRVGCIDWLYHSDIVQLAKDPSRLLALLHVRSEYGPEQWAAFDTRSARKGFLHESGATFTFNASAVVMHGEEYGRLKRLDINAARSHEEVGFPRAWVIFHMQRVIAEWLVAVVDKLTMDAPQSGNTEWKAMLAGGLRSAHDQRLWSSYHHGEFAPPLTFHPDVLLKKARDHLNMLAEEIEQLQTSPEVMRQYVLEEKANTGFEEHKSKAEVWQYVSQTLTLSWTRELERWQHLVAECEHMKAILAKSGIRKVAGARLPKDVDTALRRFGRTAHKALAEAAAEWTSQTRTINIMSEHLRRMMRVHREKVYPWNLDGQLHSHRIIHWCLYLVADTDKHLGGSSWAVGKLKEQLESTTYSTGLKNWISGIALLDEFVVLWSFRQTIDHDGPLDRDAINLELASRTEMTSTFDVTSWQIEQSLSNSLNDLECSRLLSHFCDLPLPRGRKDVKWLEKMTEARKGLTAVWTCIRNSWDERQREIGRSDEFRERLLSQMSFDISKEYLSKVAAECQQLQTKNDAGQSLRMNQERGSAFVQQAWDHRSSADGAIRKNLTKKSNAVHGDETVTDGLNKLSLHNGRAPNDEKAKFALAVIQHIAVKQDTLATMSKMFSTGDGSSGVRWALLLHALTDAGLAVTPGAGSAVTFANEYGAVSIHRPHDRDGSIVDAIMLRGIGRRLNKWFGWTSETFVLREKGDKKS